MIRLIWLALSLLTSPLLVADSELSPQRQQELLNFLVQDCGSCHGLTMEGGLGPALSPAALNGKSAEYLTAVILDGRPGTAMPPWRPLLMPVEARWMVDTLLTRNFK